MTDATYQTFDIGIVGGGPAGLSEAIWSARVRGIRAPGGVARRRRAGGD